MECVGCCCGALWGSTGEFKDGDVRRGKQGELQLLDTSSQSIATCVTFSGCYCLIRSSMCAAQPLFLADMDGQPEMDSHTHSMDIQRKDYSTT